MGIFSNANIADSTIKGIHQEKIKKQLIKQIKKDSNFSRKEKKHFLKDLSLINDPKELVSFTEELKKVSKENYNHKSTDIADKNEALPTLKDNGIAALKTSGIILGGLATMGLGIAITAMRPAPLTDLSTLFAPDALTQPYMSAFPPVKLTRIQNNAVNQQIDNKWKMVSSSLNDFGMLFLDKAVNNFSPEQRSKNRHINLEQQRKKLSRNYEYIKNKYDRLVNSKEYIELNAQSTLDKVLEHKNPINILGDGFTVQSENDFQDKIREAIEKQSDGDNKDLKELYNDFYNALDIEDKDNKKDDIKKLFSKKLFNKIIDKKFNHYFDVIDEDRKILDIINNNKKYKDIYKTAFSDITMNNDNDDMLGRIYRETLDRLGNNSIFKQQIDFENGDQKTIQDILRNTSHTSDDSYKLLAKATSVIKNNKTHNDYKKDQSDCLESIIRLIALKHASKLKTDEDYSVLNRISKEF